jgi:carbon-monoxide dehydrogenase large subunit
VPAPRFVGAHVRRLEDPRLVQGQARYVDDLQLPGLRHLASVRSPHPHARVAGIDAGSAQAAPGVAAVLLATDLARSRPSR